MGALGHFIDFTRDDGELSHPKGVTQSNSKKRNSPMGRLFAFTGFFLLLPTTAFADQVRATWYGNELRGHRTASGQVFNPEGMTAAHKSLPFGTCLVVENPRSGKRARVTVNDRGPFTPGVVLDLAWGAARAIGMLSTQSVNMRRC